VALFALLALEPIPQLFFIKGPALERSSRPRNQPSSSSGLQRAHGFAGYLNGASHLDAFAGHQ
jgi:hypothetical protein